ncbi:MAG: transposase [Syntrophobacteraceae bacterium]
MHRLLRHASGVQLLRQRLYQAAAGCEDCNDADYPRVDPALCLALGKEHGGRACQSGLCRFENAILVTRDGINKIDYVFIFGGSITSQFRYYQVDYLSPKSFGGLRCA